MNRNYFHLGLSIFFSLSVIAACTGNKPPVPIVPTTDLKKFEASVASTAQALTKQAAIPTATPAVITTATAVISSYGTSLTKLTDGSALFTDQRAGVQITFPANWLAMRVGEPEYYQAWEGPAAGNLILLDAITSAQNLDLNTYRIVAFDIDPDHVLYENIPKINVVFVQGDVRTLRQVEYDERTQSSILKGYKFLPSEFKKTSSGLEVLILKHQWEATTSTTHETYTGYYKGFLFKVPDGTVAIDLFIPLDQQEPLELELDQIIDGVTLLNP